MFAQTSREIPTIGLNKFINLYFHLNIQIVLQSAISYIISFHSQGNFEKSVFPKFIC